MKTYQKNNTLKSLSALLKTHEKAIIQANQADLGACDSSDPSLMDRLKVDEEKIGGMIQALDQTIRLKDPVGESLYFFEHANGLKIENRRVPFGRILIIYESRPDVTIEAAATAFKAGNTVLLKGGSEARRTNILLTELWREALRSNELDPDCVSYLDLSREETQALIKTNSHHADLIIPRGGAGLIDFIKNNTDIPLIISGRGNNFLLIDKTSDFEMAIRIAVNGKSRLSVCNALDKILIHRDLPDLKSGLAKLRQALEGAGIEVLNETGDALMRKEFLSAKILIRMIDGLDEGIQLINLYSGGHSATIVTKDKARAERFQNGVDCAAVYHNASTRFTDGGEFGMGAEIAISTQKLHARGPVSISQLVTNKWFIDGEGQIRE